MKLKKDSVEVIDLNTVEEIESVQMENEVSSERELTEQQQEDLGKMLNMIDNEADETGQLIESAAAKVSNIKSKFSKMYMPKKIAITLVTIVIAIVGLVAITYNNELDSFNEEYEKTLSANTSTVIEINIGEDTKQIDCNLVKVSIQNDNGLYTEMNDFSFVDSNIDTVYDKYSIDGTEYIIDKQPKLHSLLLNNKYMYVEYTNTNKNANKEIIFCSDKPLNIDLTGLNKKTLRFFEKSNPIMVKGYVNSFNNSFLMVNEALGGGELSIDTLENEILNIESTMKTSQNNKGIILNIGNLASLNLSELSILGDSPQIVYKETDKVLRVSHKEINSDYLYIYSIYENIMGLNPEDLLQTNIENVFIHKQFDSEESAGFCTFAILDGDNIYCFKTVNRDLALEVLEQLGLDSSQFTIDKIQSVIKIEETEEVHSEEYEEVLEEESYETQETDEVQE